MDYPLFRRKDTKLFLQGIAVRRFYLWFVYSTNITRRCRFYGNLACPKKPDHPVMTEYVMPPYLHKVRQARPSLKKGGELIRELFK
jgi:hypothetical protein